MQRLEILQVQQLHKGSLQHLQVVERILSIAVWHLYDAAEVLKSVVG